MKSIAAIPRKIVDVSRFERPPDGAAGRMGSRAIYRDTMRTAWPAVTESVLMSLIGVADTIMVSVLGPVAVAAVALTTQPLHIAMTTLQALNVGVTAVVARRKGEERPKEAREVLRQALLLGLCLSVVVSLLMRFFSTPVLALAGANSDTMAWSSSYLRIMLLGVPIHGMTICINAAQRGVGNTRLALVTNVLANAVNLGLDAILITGWGPIPAMGVAGDAIATVCGYVAALGLALRSVRRADGFLYLRFSGAPRITRKVIGPVVKVGSSAMVESLCARVGFFLTTRFAANLGTMSMAAHGMVGNISSISFSVGDGLSISAASLVGRNMGKKRPDLAQAHGAACQRIGLIGAACLVTIFVSLRGNVVRLFNADAQIIALAMWPILILAFLSPGQISQVITGGALRGSGDTRYVAIVSLISMAILRPTLTYLLAHPVGLGLAGIWLGISIDQYCRLTAYSIRFYSGKWKKIKL